MIIDRLGRQRTSVGSDVFSAISAAMIPVFALAGVLTYPLVVVASVIGSVFDPVGVTAREAMLPDVAKQAHLPLERVNGVHEAIWGLGWLIGPGMAGVLIAAIGAELSFWAMFGGFVASALLVGLGVMRTPPPVVHVKQHWIRDALDGARIVIRDPAIRSTTVLSTIVFAISYSVLAVVLPVIYERLDKPRELGVLLMVFSAGGVIGALLYSAFGTRMPRRVLFVAGMIVTAVLIGVLALDPAYWVLLVAMAIGGALNGPVAPIANVVLQERVAEQARGRALSMVFAFAYALYPVGYVASGFLINATSITFTLVAAAVITGLAALWSLFTPALRNLDAPS